MFYSVNSPEGKEVIQSMQAKIVSIGENRGVGGTMNLREIDPADVGLTACTITVGAGESSYTLTRDIKENSVLAIGGFHVGDDILGRVEIWRGNAKLHTWNLREIASLQDKSGLVPLPDPVYYGPGETMKLIFYPRSTSTAAQTSDTWFNGLVLCPNMQSVATRATT